LLLTNINYQQRKKEAKKESNNSNTNLIKNYKSKSKGWFAARAGSRAYQQHGTHFNS
jgi:hypothetical protein